MSDTDPTLDGAPSFRLEPHEIRKTEQAFRRGFNHAAQYAYDALRGGATIEDIGRWLDATDDWRFNQSRDVVSTPPSVFRERKAT